MVSMVGILFQTVDTDFSPGDNVTLWIGQENVFEFQTVDTDFSPGDYLGIHFGYGFRRMFQTVDTDFSPGDPRLFSPRARSFPVVSDR